MDSVRRCRRCKRKRLDDEPPEVQQYKTCAKCRIIERNKKNSRKPLAEETMLYGLKQFKEQSVGGNYMEDEGLLRDEFFRRYHNKPFNYEVELNKVISNPNYTPPVLLPPTKSYTFKSTTIPMQFNQQQQQHQQQHQQIHLQQPRPPLQQPQYQQYAQNQPQQQYQQYSQNQQLLPQYQLQPYPQPSRYSNSQPQFKNQPQQFTNHHQSGQYVPAKPSNPIANNLSKYDVDDDIYTELSKLGNLNELNGKSDDNNDPYSYKNVYNNYQEYLLTILSKINNQTSINNLVYLKEFDEEFTFNLSRMDSTANQKDINSNSNYSFNRYSNKIGSEKHFRAILLNNLKANYIDPIIAILNIDFNQSSNNLNDFKSSSTIKSFHNFIYNENSIINNSNSSMNLSLLSKIKTCSIYMNYDRRYNLLILKLNFILYQPSKFKYSLDFKKKIVDLFKRLHYEKTLTNSIVPGRIDYNSNTAQIVYDRLLQDELISNELSKVEKNAFIGDFVNFESVFTIDDEESQDEEEEEEDDEDDEEDDDDDDLNPDQNDDEDDESMEEADTTINPNGTINGYSTKEGTADFDPILKR